MAGLFFTSQSKLAANLLLDLYPGAVLALSLRRLRTAYAGACIRVRNSLGNELDIGFVGNYVDVATWTTFLNGNPGTIVGWYDQSLIGNNASQPVLTSQPTCVLSDAGLNGRPSMALATNDFMSFPTLFSPQTDFTAFIVDDKSSVLSPILGDSTAGSYSLISHWYDNVLLQGVAPGYDQYGPENPANYGYLSLMITSNPNKKVYKNGIQLIKTSTINQTFRFNVLGKYPADGFYFNGNIADVIVYPNLQSDDCRLKFEADVRTDYNLA